MHTFPPSFISICLKMTNLYSFKHCPPLRFRSLSVTRLLILHPMDFVVISFLTKLFNTNTTNIIKNNVNNILPLNCHVVGLNVLADLRRIYLSVARVFVRCKISISSIAYNTSLHFYLLVMFFCLSVLSCLSAFGFFYIIWNQPAIENLSMYLCAKNYRNKA